MKAIVYNNYGSPDVLRLEDVAKPVPKGKEILVRISAAAVTSGDIRMRKADPVLVRVFNGWLKPKRNILGVDFAGVVESIGKDVIEFRSGDEVFGAVGFDMGTYAEYRCIPQDAAVLLKPLNITFEQAAAVPFGALTSLHFLRAGKIQKGQKVLIYGASGSLGTAAVQLAKYFGAEVTAVCSAANAELVRSLGAAKVIDYNYEDFSKGNVTYDIIYDTVGKGSFRGSLKSLKKDGYYLRAVHIDPSSMIRGLWANTLSSRKVIGGVATDRKEDLQYIKELIETGNFKPVLDRCYPIEEAAEAHRYVEKGHKKGNVILNI